uniref:DM domain-containing protein n=1 Tax=Oryctolagus cuniculus TaxID=9986 RepID=G1SF83_RABIT
MKADAAKLADKMLRAPKCSRCRNHGFLVPVKGHAGKCGWKQCTCDKCCLITERQKIMAAQKVLRKQASEEEQELALGPQAPELAAGAVAGAAAASQGPGLHLLPPPAASGDLRPEPEGRAAAYFCERPPRGPSPGPSAFQPVLGGRGHVAAQLGLEAARPGRPWPPGAVQAAAAPAQPAVRGFRAPCELQLGSCHGGRVPGARAFQAVPEHACLLPVPAGLPGCGPAPWDPAADRLPAHLLHPVSRRQLGVGSSGRVPVHLLPTACPTAAPVPPAGLPLSAPLPAATSTAATVAFLLADHPV